MMIRNPVAVIRLPASRKRKRRVWGARRGSQSNSTAYCACGGLLRMAVARLG